MWLQDRNRKQNSGNKQRDDNDYVVDFPFASDISYLNDPSKTSFPFHFLKVSQKSLQLFKVSMAITSRLIISSWDYPHTEGPITKNEMKSCSMCRLRQDNLFRHNGRNSFSDIDWPKHRGFSLVSARMLAKKGEGLEYL